MTDNDDYTLNSSLLSETAKIQWKQLEYFFANNRAIYVSKDLDLIEVASMIAKDNKNMVEQWMQSNLIMHVTSKQARQWLDNNSTVWAVVVKPWVLVQDLNT